MPISSDKPSKEHALKATGTLNHHAEKVSSPLFVQSAFFDPRDMPQIKYEALRAIEVDGYSIRRAAGEFGLSRPTLYQAREQLERRGLEGLLPRKPGPKRPHKLNADVRHHLETLAAEEPGLNSRQLARRLQQKFKLDIHPRTLEKALKPKAKKGRSNSR